MQRLGTEKISEIADAIYRRYFGNEVVEVVSADEFFDWTGKEAIRVTVMIKPGTIGLVKGKSLGGAALDLQDKLTSAGEDRFAHVGFGEVGEIFEDDAPDPDDPAFEDDDVHPGS